MKIEIEDMYGEHVMDIEADCAAFNVGETITLCISNEDPAVWKDAAMVARFRIEKIKHYYFKTFSYYRQINKQFSTTITVSKID